MTAALVVTGLLATAGTRPAPAPDRGHTVRLAADTTLAHKVAQSPLVTAVSPATDELDAFALGPDNAVETASWAPGFSDGWHGWTPLNGGVAAPNTQVGAVSMGVNRLDAFVVGTDYHAYWASRSPGDSAWQGWSTLDSPPLAPGSSITAVSRSADNMDIFAVGADYTVYTDSYGPWVGWHGWQSLGVSVAPGTSVYGVSRGLGEVDVFAVRAGDRHIITAAWSDAAPGWRGWWEINGGVAAPNTSVTAVSRGQDQLDIFAVGADNRVYTAAWEPGFTDGWHGWWNVNGLQVAPGTSVFGVSQGWGDLDIYAVGTDNKVYTAAWHPDFTDGWHGWWPLKDNDDTTVEPGTSVFAVSRSPGHLDVFAINSNSGIYTAAWESDFADGWHGWWPVAQLLSIQWSAVVTFPSGIAVGGTASVAFFSDGTFTYSVALHSTAILHVVPYDVEESMSLVDVATGAVFVLHGEATVWSDGGWNQVGSDSQIAAHWANLSTNYRLIKTGSESVNWAALIDQIAAIYNDAKTIYDASNGDTTGTDM